MGKNLQITHQSAMEDLSLTFNNLLSFKSNQVKIITNFINDQ